MEQFKDDNGKIYNFINIQNTIHIHIMFPIQIKIFLQCPFIFFTSKKYSSYKILRLSNLSLFLHYQKSYIF